MKTKAANANMQKAKLPATVLNVVGCIYPFIVFYLPESQDTWYNVALGLVMALPVAALFLLIGNRGQVMIDTNKNSQRSSVVFALVVPSLILFVLGFGFHIVDYGPIFQLCWKIVVVFCVSFLFFGWPKGAKTSSKFGAVLIVAGCSFFYSFGVAEIVNCRYDRGPVQQYETTILKRWTEKSKSTNYYFQLSPFGPTGRGGDKVFVTRRFYSAHELGDGVTVVCHEGALGAGWYDPK